MDGTPTTRPSDFPEADLWPASIRCREQNGLLIRDYVRDGDFSQPNPIRLILDAGSALHSIIRVINRTANTDLHHTIAPEHDLNDFDTEKDRYRHKKTVSEHYTARIHETLLRGDEKLLTEPPHWLR